ncbi:sugar ABC transporter substrate-binding protein, partial [Aeromonas enteropelogenes]
RVATQILSRGTPKLGDELAEVSQAVLLGKMEPKAAAERLEQGLKGWYAPHQGSKVAGQECQCDAGVTQTSAVTATQTAPQPAAQDAVEQALSSELETPQQ